MTLNHKSIDNIDQVIFNSNTLPKSKSKEGIGIGKAIVALTIATLMLTGCGKTPAAEASKIVCSPEWTISNELLSTSLEEELNIVMEDEEAALLNNVTDIRNIIIAIKEAKNDEEKTLLQQQLVANAPKLEQTADLLMKHEVNYSTSNENYAFENIQFDAGSELVITIKNDNESKNISQANIPKSLMDLHTKTNSLKQCKRNGSYDSTTKYDEFTTIAENLLKQMASVTTNNYELDGNKIKEMPATIENIQKTK